MVKISELNNKQLVSQIAKYEKILGGLNKERSKRISSNPELSTELATKKAGNSDADLSITKSKTLTKTPVKPVEAKSTPDKKPEKELKSAKTQNNDNNLEVGFQVDVEEIERIQEAQAKDSVDDEGTVEEEVQVTTLLKLSKEKLASLKSASNKKTKK